ncbi:hypothetical protein BOTBODRAFT_632851 [Botryobasidium botryosum FD-172 SS1]|uniref:Uncharacterized protein n=1 Tax=Botryobasidium botryosum (strain FD-172 SS1) TaxID=930990 RepID=A0A067MXH2_BOTB1|nr:hypothetical protein BOTBODRAFT_632851 [Botryobasidium botryosum FD-172 SS1]
MRHERQGIEVHTAVRSNIAPSGRRDHTGLESHSDQDYASDFSTMSKNTEVAKKKRRVGSGHHTTPIDHRKSADRRLRRAPLYCRHPPSRDNRIVKGSFGQLSNKPAHECASGQQDPMFTQ